MRIDRNSRLVRWAYFASDHGTPDRTSLCALFWRTVLLTPLKISALALLASALTWIVYFALVGVWFEIGWRAALTIYGFVATVIGLVIAGKKTSEWSRRRAMVEREPSAIGKGFKAIKSRYCPIIEID